MEKQTVSRLIKKYKIRPKKQWGQNFLIDPNLIDKLVDSLELYPDEDILEIASGLGCLSYELSKFALEVLAIEKDKRLVTIARQEFGSQKNLKFFEGDFLECDLPHLLHNYHLPMKVFGNIPYPITSKILFKLLENHSLFQYAVLTMQKEVADRLTAEPGGKEYGILTVQFQAQTLCERLFNLEPTVFYPEPKVLSTAVKITFPKSPPYQIHKPLLFKNLVRTAFRTRRKTIQNNLKKLLKNNKIKPWEPCGISPGSRPEQISVAQYVALANYLSPLL